MTRRFSITWDYRCPYARIGHDHVVTGLKAGADWDVTFLPFSLGQAHVSEGQPDVWDAPDADTGLFALQVGIAVRDRWPHRFLDVHRAIFEHRHVHAGDLRDREAFAALLAAHDLDPDKVLAEVHGGGPLATIKAEHTGYVASHRVWGVPTFLVGDSAVFVRLLQPSGGDEALAISTVERVLDQIAWPLLNEFKHTSIPR